MDSNELPPPSGKPAAGWYPDPERMGQDRWWNGEQWTTGSRRDISTADPSEWTLLDKGPSHWVRQPVFWAAIAVVVLMVWYSNNNTPTSDAGASSPVATNAPVTTRPQADGDVVAYVGCQQEIERTLKAPATAEYVQTYSQATRSLGGSRYQVEVDVDAENGFGAFVRTHFSCTVSVNGDRYTVESLTAD